MMKALAPDLSLAGWAKATQNLRAYCWIFGEDSVTYHRITLSKFLEQLKLFLYCQFSTNLLTGL